MMTLPRLLPVFALVFIAACQQSSEPPSVPTPTLTLTPASVNVNAGGAPVTFTATVQNSSEAVTWVYSGSGSVSPAPGFTSTFSPPERVADVQSGSLTATLGSTGVSATAPIVIYPASVTPPTEPPPVNPPPINPPTNPPPTNPPPTNPPPTAKFEVSIAALEPVTLGMDGTAMATLDASTKNAPDGATTYLWTAAVSGVPTKNVTFAAPTAEDTTVTFLAADTYTLHLTATNGAQTATDTLTVTVNPVPQDVTGIWSGSYTTSGGMPRPLALELTEDRTKAVTGTFKADGGSVAVTGTFDDPRLELTYEFDGKSIKITATVTGEDMSGDLGSGFPFTAKRTPLEP